MTSIVTGRLKFAVLATTAIAAFALIGGACGGDDDDDGTPQATTAATQPAAADPTDVPAASEPTEPAAGGPATITTADAGALGTILTSIDGYTLYTFDNDVAGSGASACTAGCVAAWPPFPVADPVGTSDVTGELGSITRDDGSPQATYKGKPLYMFASDAAPGDTNGDGVSGVWHVATP